jgi:hypothetical protein
LGSGAWHPYWLGTACGGNLIGWLMILTGLLVGKGLWRPFSLVGIKKEAVLIGGIEDCGASFWQRAQFVTSLLAGIRSAPSLIARINDKAILIGWDLNKRIWIMNP